jgi:hypothetical protein
LLSIRTGLDDVKGSKAVFGFVGTENQSQKAKLPKTILR